MRVLTIILTILAFWFGARIADDPLAGLLAGAVVATVLVLVQRRRRQASPPKRS
ncbi:hypothetical protein [Massilia alkalitolerans]|jgi:hypothetical protein|uniref:hypothetical protein n=1 Tax=Massilia alkalitolerans TaxID=286638 RepID=UPI000412D053|nr:hypothetical protein [Massilia alkalitolerans]